MSKMAKVVIVGRTNVGKSTLFNRLSTEVKSITLDYEGVTRDFLTDTVCWQGRCFELIDTGGISLRKSEDPLTGQARDVALSLLEKAELILFVCDGKVGVLQEDREITKLLHKLNKPVILAVNKIDTKIAQEHLFEFERLGLQPLIPISAQHGTGIGDLLDEMIKILPEKIVAEEKEVRYNIALLGKPNVGKSSLLNLLLQEERAIVSSVPGTTREALAGEISFYKEDIRITDTPGLRRKRGITEEIETLMVKSALRAVDEAEIILLLVDAAQGRIFDQELKLAFYTFQEKNKALILLFNKQDLVVDELMKEDLTHSLEEYAFFLKNIEQLTISCKTQKNIGKILPLIKKVWERHNQRFADDALTLLFKEALEKKPLYHKSEPLYVFRVQQVTSAPITILMIVNKSQWFGPSQRGFFEGILRKEYDLKSVPIRFIIRAK